MHDPEIRSRLDLALQLAREAEAITVPAFFSREFQTEHKSDGSVVTTADRACERFLRDRVERAFPRDAFLGEEWGATEGGSAFRWVVDPIDGTASFVRGVPMWGTLIGVEMEGRPVIGVVSIPALSEIVWGATGQGAWHAARGGAPSPARVSSARTLGESLVVVTSSDYFRKRGILPALERLQAVAGSMRGWSDCYAQVLLATGRVDAVVEPMMHPWDVVAGAAVVGESGGAVVSLQGDRTHSAGDAILCAPGLLDELVRVVRG